MSAKSTILFPAQTVTTTTVVTYKNHGLKMLTQHCQARYFTTLVLTRNTVTGIEDNITLLNLINPKLNVLYCIQGVDKIVY